MADIIDNANDLADALRSDSLNSIRGQVPQERPDIEDDTECDQCGSNIPAARAARGYVLCVSCQSYIERSNKQFNRDKSRYYEYED